MTTILTSFYSNYQERGLLVKVAVIALRLDHEVAWGLEEAAQL
jgi:hypothetical protein